MRVTGHRDFGGDEHTISVHFAAADLARVDDPDFIMQPVEGDPASVVLHKLSNLAAAIEALTEGLE